MECKGLGSSPYRTGVLILQQKWEEVVDSILSHKPQDMTFHNKPNVLSFNECIDLWRTTRNAKEVYKQFPYKWTPEGSLLKGLTRVAPNDFNGAICNGMVRNQRLLYLHCFQSYVWNKSASHRIKEYGLKVVVGDLLELDAEDVDSNQTTNKNRNRNVVVANEDNIKMASIYNIVLPVVGTDNIMPNNSVSDYIESLLTEEGITLEMYRNLPKQWCCFGTYRKLFVRPENFDYQWIQYKDPNIALIDNDLTIINKKFNKSDQQLSDVFNSVDNKNDIQSEKLALKLSISLPSSSYATMICRQITRTETTLLESKPWLCAKYGIK